MNQKGFVNLVLIGVVVVLVAVSSYFAWAKKSNNIKNTEPLAVTTPRTDTSNWKAYTDAEYGYEILYPNSWNYKVYEDTLTLSSTTTPRKLEGGPGNEISITVFPFGSSLDLDSWLKKEYQGEIDWAKTSIIPYTNSQGIKFVKIKGAPGFSSDNIGAYTLMGAKVIMISVLPATKYESIFDVVLESLKFTK